MVENGTQTESVSTVGHSNRDREEFLRLVVNNNIRRIVDVRTYPNSRRYPHFSQGNLRQSLSDVGIQYVHVPELGGLRTAREASHNSALSGGFQAVADHLNTDEGQEALEELESSIREPDSSGTLALLCAERDPDSCHRSLIADHLISRGFSVRHLIDDDEVRDHDLHPHARRKDGRVQYPGLV